MVAVATPWTRSRVGGPGAVRDRYGRRQRTAATKGQGKRGGMDAAVLAGNRAGAAETASTGWAETVS